MNTLYRKMRSKKYMHFWKSVMAAGLAALMICGCGNNYSVRQSASINETAGSDVQKASSEESDLSQRDQKHPLCYFALSSTGETSYLCYIDEVLTDKLNIYPFPSYNFTHYSTKKGTVTADGKWLYLIGIDPNQNLDTPLEEDGKNCLFRIATEDLTQDAEKNAERLQKIVLDYNVEYGSEIRCLPNGSILLVIHDSQYRRDTAVFQVTDSEVTMIKDGLSEWKILEDGTLIYSIRKDGKHYGSVRYDDTDGKLKAYEITLEKDVEVLCQDSNAVYYHTKQRGDPGIVLTDYVKGDYYTGNLESLGETELDFTLETNVAYDTTVNSFYYINNGEMDIAQSKLGRKDWFSTYRYYNLYSTSDGSAELLAEETSYPYYDNGLFVYNKIDDPEGKMYYVFRGGQETELEGVTGEIGNLYRTTDGKTVMIKAGETYYTATVENNSLTDISEVRDAVEPSFVYREHVYYCGRSDGNLYVLENGEWSMAAEGAAGFKDIYIEEDGCVMLYDGVQKYEFYKNGEKIGDTFDIDGIQGRGQYIGDNLFVYSVNRGAFDLVTYITLLTPQGTEVLHEIEGYKAFNLQEFDSISVRDDIVYW